MRRLDIWGNVVMLGYENIIPKKNFMTKVVKFAVSFPVMPEVKEP
jgi:hypothetical protein